MNEDGWMEQWMNELMQVNRVDTLLKNSISGTLVDEWRNEGMYEWIQVNRVEHFAEVLHLRYLDRRMH